MNIKIIRNYLAYVTLSVAQSLRKLFEELCGFRRTGILPVLPHKTSESHYLVEILHSVQNDS